MAIGRTGRRFVLGGLLVGSLAVNSASAVGLGYEPFQYSTGTLAGQAGGSGFTSAWSSGPGATGTPDAVVSPGLSQSGATGNAFRVGSSAGVLHEYTRFFTPVTTNGSVAWLRFLLRADTIPSTGSPAGGIGLTGSGAGPFIGLGDSTGGVYVSQYKVGPPSVVAPTHIATGQTFDLLVRITLAAGNDTVDLWINADPNALPAPNATNNQLDFTINALHPAAFDNGVVTIDEIRLGTTLADVVPEPSAAILLLPAAIAAHRRRRCCVQAQGA